MPPNIKAELSLLQLWQAQAPGLASTVLTAEAFQVSLQSMSEFLSHHRIQARLLTKLPAGDGWHGPLKSYHQSLGESPGWYRLSPPGQADLRLQAASRVEVNLALAAWQLWPEDYFVLVQADNFVSLLLAHGPLEAAVLEKGAAVAEQRLTVVCSIGPGRLGQLLAAMQDQLRPLCADPQSDLVPLIDWQRRLATTAAHPTALQTLQDHWWSWQLASQDRLLRAHQQRVQGLTTLSDQNQLLLNSLGLKDRFLKAMGQELRTPLTTIKTALTLLHSPQLKPAQRQRYLAMISTECDRQSAVINGVLNLLQMETSLRESPADGVYPADTIPPVVSTYQPLATEKGISLTYTIADDLPQVACPDLWLRQIVIHLLNNSIKYTARGGKIWVSARQMGRSIQLEVVDTGVGILPSDLPHIFNYFYRGRQRDGETMEGSGLGLAIVQQLLLFCDGNITASSEVGRGSRFLVQLPMQSPKAASHPAATTDVYPPA
ncbi:MAG: HAMP domain-containing histidine kinase [Cyanobacteria bacterium REEB459]|nr:HAMP domain-containing histidine kinase [Cyanobacteria bacterium REEB459]